MGRYAAYVLWGMAVVDVIAGLIDSQYYNNRGDAGYHFGKAAINWLMANQTWSNWRNG
jgi:hypothetical protein